MEYSHSQKHTYIHIHRGEWMDEKECDLGNVLSENQQSKDKKKWNQEKEEEEEAEEEG